ncbi:MAG TPA: hypothetical protein VNH11_16840 [Pirellulales bacterium]|nr:hypothetical protein [Pirellulales bacterium]
MGPTILPLNWLGWLYLQIIGLGRAALPHLFREIARQPDHWFSALAAITGEDPIPAGAEGNMAAMTAA